MQVLFLVIILFQHLIKAVIGFGFRTFFGGEIEAEPLFVTLAIGIVKVYNHKYGGEKCRTPHLTEEEIKAAFIKAVNLLLENRTEIAENVGMIRKAICDTTSLEADRDRLFDEMSMLSDLTQTLIAENARVVMNQEDYNRRFQALSKQYDAAKQRHEQVQRQIQELAVRGQQLEQFQ